MENKFEMGPLQKEWVKTLREHPERQHTRSLGFKDEEGWHLCCLGQLYVLAVGEENALVDGIVACNGDEKVLSGMYLECGLNNNTGSLKGGFYTHKDQSKSWMLSAMNDKGATWPEIADFIEANPSKVFTKAV